MHLYADVDLNLPTLWFTGAEWKSGAARKALVAQYKQALAEAKLNPPARRVRNRRLFMGFPNTIEGLVSMGYKHSGTSDCRACKAPIEWWETPNKKKLPMDHGTAIPHWSTCPNAEDFRKPKAGRSTFEANHE
jgi:hypothetical protein